MGKSFNMAMTGGAWFSVILDFCGWAILLGGVAGMQQACGGSRANNAQEEYLGGVSGYNSPVSCDQFFGYTWWITFYNLIFLVAAVLTLLKGMTSFRPGIVAMASIVIMQSIVVTNNYLNYNEIDTTSSTFDARAQVTVAGAMLQAIAAMLFVCCTGARDENETIFESTPKKASKEPIQQQTE